MATKTKNEGISATEGDKPVASELSSSFASELKRSSLVLAVLGVLKEAEYGYGLIAKLDSVGISVEPDTLYPLLRRLESQGLLKGEWNTSSAKPRKYYARTALGDAAFGQFYECWSITAQSIERIGGGTDKSRQSQTANQCGEDGV